MSKPYDWKDSPKVGHGEQMEGCGNEVERGSRRAWTILLLSWNMIACLFLVHFLTKGTVPGAYEACEPGGSRPLES